MLHGSVSPDSFVDNHIRSGEKPPPFLHHCPPSLQSAAEIVTAQFSIVVHKALCLIDDIACSKVKTLHRDLAHLPESEGVTIERAASKPATSPASPWCDEPTAVLPIVCICECLLSLSFVAGTVSTS